jgi:hypothetical protein
MAQLQVYPTFDIPSLEERCKKDISDFIKEPLHLNNLY